MAQLTQPVQILQVEANHGTGRTGKPYTIFKVKASDGNSYDTFDEPTAKAAGAHVGAAPVVLEFEARQNGAYTNYDLRGVHAGGAAPAPVAPGIQPTGPSYLPPPQSVPVQPTSIPVHDPSAKDAKITRLAAQKSAANLIGHLHSGSGSVRDIIGDFRALVEELVQHAETGKWASSIQVNPGGFDPPAAVPPAQSAQTGEIPWHDAAA